MGRIVFEKSWPIVGPGRKLYKIVVGGERAKEFWCKVSKKEQLGKREKKVVFEKSWPIVGPRWKLDKLVVNLGDGHVKEFWSEMSKTERLAEREKMYRGLQSTRSRWRRSP